jgi:protein SCO1
VREVTASPGRRRRRLRIAVTLSLVAALLIAVNVYAAYVVASQRHPSLPRASGIPANISTSLANLMELSPLGAVRAPGFTLTDQNGRTMTLSSLRGKVVVLQFMDPHCTDICPIVSQEFVDAYHDLGARAGKVVFAAINVNQFHTSVRAMAAFSAAHQLTSIPGWHFFTGAVPALRAAWRDYHIQVAAPSRNADVLHTSAVYFIDARGYERFVGSPMVDHTAQGTSYLPLRQLAAWGRGIALVAGDLAR